MTAFTIVRPRADWVRALEAAYAPEPDDATWDRGVVAAVGGLLRCDDGVVMNVVEHDRDCVGGASLLRKTDSASRRSFVVEASSAALHARGGQNE